MAVRSKVTSRQSPVASEEFAGLVEPLYSDTSPRFAIAVSGGADSMALLLLASCWADERGGSVVALTLDHGLRPEAKDEALWVAGWCKTQSIEHHTLRWSPPALSSAIQEQARNARYHLLAQWCHAHSISHLLTAHHRDDQAETLFFRLARGSGLDGLACMMPVVTLEYGIQLLRPLLPIGKARLIATLQAQGQSWIEDPSNQNINYTRNRIRALIAESGNEEGINERAYQITDALRKFCNILYCNAASKLTSCTSTSSDGSMSIDNTAFSQLEPEYGLRVIAAIVKQIGKGEYKPRTEKLERFYAQLCDDIRTGSAKKRSFAHCIFRPHPKKGVITVMPELRATLKNPAPYTT